MTIKLGPGTAGGGGAPSGAAGGVLSGTYPDPGFAADMATQAELDAAQALNAPKASPTLTGTPVAPTAAQGTNTTQIATTAYVQANRAANPTLVMPMVSSAFPTNIGVGVAFRYYFIRFVAPKTGTLAGIAVWVGVASGNMEVGVYDTGDASATNASRLHDSGSIAVPAAGWKEVATPGVSLTAGQHFIVVVQVDNATASFGNRVMVSSNGSPMILPATYAVAAGGLASKLVGFAGTPGALSMPSTIAEATFTDPGTSSVPIPICRMS